MLFLAPFLAAMVLFQYVPLVQLVWDSFRSFSIVGAGSNKFVGLGNYRQLLNDPVGRGSIFTTAIFAVGLMAGEIALGLGLALLLQRATLPRKLLRSLIFWPVVTSAVVVTTMWTFIYDPAHGLLDSAVSAVGLRPLALLTSSSQALPALLVMTIWEEVGISMLLYLSGLQSISKEVLEAATVDGAAPARRFWHVTLPLLRRSTAVVVVVATVFAFQTFAPAYIMTQGGPDNATNFLVYEIYNQAFTYFQPGYAAALSVGLVLIIVAVTAVELRLLRPKHEV